MSFNLSQLPVDQRAAIQHHRQCCLENYQQQLQLDTQLAVDAAWEFSRLLNARAEHKAGWREWVRQQLIELDDPELVAILKRRLNGYLHKAGQGLQG
jgi:hypothetical protein